MKKLLIIIIFLKLTQSQAQFYIGSQGITIQNGTVFSYDNLSLKPDADFTLSNNSLQRSSIPIPGNPIGSINRVYSFGTPVAFSGEVTIVYLSSELNGNAENGLQIAYAWDENQGTIVTSGSTRTQDPQQVSNNISVTRLRILSASATGNALPVSLVDFTVSAEGQTARLRWSTTSEINASRFDIERSPDGRHWLNVGSKAVLGDSRVVKNYSFQDAHVEDGTNYYRLKMIDKDESFAYSNIRAVVFSIADNLVIFPNPVAEKLFLKNILLKNIRKVSVYDITGRRQIEGAFIPEDGLNIKHLSPGTYVLSITQSNGQQISIKFTKQ